MKPITRPVVLFSVVVALFLGGRFIYYGSFTSNCIYTEKSLPLPEQLIEKDFVIVKDAYQAIGSNSTFACLESLGSIQREIVSPKTIENPSVGSKYYTNNGLAVESLEKGQVFTLVDVIALTKQGITTIDSGRGPINYLILKDQNNILYRIATVSLGINEGDEFLALADSDATETDSTIKLLSARSFDSSRSTDSVGYNGILTETTTKDLKSSRPQWKKLADRLEQGEELEIYINLQLWDGQGSVTLSDNPTERKRQVAQIQELFLSKIPSDLLIENLDKNEVWPNLSMKANLDLLNYIGERQGQLKIESISELTRM